MSSLGVQDHDQERDVRWMVIQEELRFLVEGGSRDGDEIARRLGFRTRQALERYCYRYAIPLFHLDQRDHEDVLPDLNIKMDARPDSAFVNTPEEVHLATLCVARQLQHVDIKAIPEILNMLGLNLEPQLA